jgi:hypothetical protein
VRKITEIGIRRKNLLSGMTRERQIDKGQGRRGHLEDHKGANQGPKPGDKRAISLLTIKNHKRRGRQGRARAYRASESDEFGGSMRLCYAVFQAAHNSYNNNIKMRMAWRHKKAGIIQMKGAVHSGDAIPAPPAPST